MKRMSLLVLMLSLTAMMHTACAEGRRVALLVGVGVYPDGLGLVTPLASTGDAAKLKETLVSQGWTVYLLNDAAPDDFQPRRNNILHALGAQIDTVSGAVTYTGSSLTYLGKGALTSADTLLFYYGGHGITGGDADAVDYLIPSDVRKNGDAFDKSTLVSMNVVESALGATGAGKVLMFTDACRETAAAHGQVPVWHGVTGSAPDGSVFEVATPGMESYWLKASTPGQASWEMKEQPAGVFSHFLWQALQPDGSKTADTNHDGTLSLEELEQYVTSRTVNYVQGTLQKTQTPEHAAKGDPAGWESKFGLVSGLMGTASEGDRSASPPGKLSADDLKAIAACITSLYKQNPGDIFKERDNKIYIDTDKEDAAAKNAFIGLRGPRDDVSLAIGSYRWGLAFRGFDDIDPKADNPIFRWRSGCSVEPDYYNDNKTTLTYDITLSKSFGDMATAIEWAKALEAYLHDNDYVGSGRFLYKNVYRADMEYVKGDGISAEITARVPAPVDENLPPSCAIWFERKFQMPTN